MQCSVFNSMQDPAARCIVLVAALLCVSSLGVFADRAHASDLQRSTDRAAVEAKRDLCIALNQRSDSSQLKVIFFGFYEGKIVSAARLHPDTFRIGQIGPVPPFKVVQVLGPNEMLASIDFKVFKLRDVSTADTADGQTIRLNDFFSVRDTETYDTVAGSTKTVYILVPAKDKAPAVKPTRIYPWYDKKNEAIITGEFKVIDGPNAVFLVNGQESSVPLTKFTRGDRELMRLLMARYPQDKQQDNKPQDKPPARPIGID